MRDCKKFCRPNLVKYPKAGDIIILLSNGLTGVVTAKEYESIKNYFKKISDYELNEGGGGSQPTPTPGPTPIPVEGDIQIFADPECTEYASGEAEKVYVRVNTPWVGLDSGWSITTGPDGNMILTDSPTSLMPNAPYGILLWVDWGGHIQYEPYAAGQVVEITANYNVDITNFTKVFSKS